MARTPIFTTKYNKFQHVYPLYFERFFHTHTHLSACLVLYPNFARIRVSSFRNTPVCVCVCTKCARKFFPACYFHYFPTGVVCVYGGKGKLCHGKQTPPPRFHYFSLRVGSLRRFCCCSCRACNATN